MSEILESVSYSQDYKCIWGGQHIKYLHNGQHPVTKYILPKCKHSVDFSLPSLSHFHNTREGGWTEGGETQVSSPAPTTMAYNKFAQIYRNRFASEMFQVETKNSPPSLTKISPQVDLIR